MLARLSLVVPYSIAYLKRGALRVQYVPIPSGTSTSSPTPPVRADGEEAPAETARAHWAAGS
jgi:hypothetical protein